MAKTKNLYRLPFHKNVKTKPESSPTHKGPAKYSIDFSMREGTKILATADGKVVKMKDDSNEGGLEKKYSSPKGLEEYMNRIHLKHANGEYSGYYHIKYRSTMVKEGQIVKEGQPIGLCGSTGYSEGPHLHFMIWKNIKPKKGKPNWQTMKIRFKK